MKTKETDITQMSLGQIAWHVMYRYRVTELIALNVCTLTYLFVQQAPIVAHNLTR